jgi:hypothetical protein
MPKIISHIAIHFILIMALASSFVIAEHPDSTLCKLQNNLELIKTASANFNINWKTLAGIIYVERTNNVDWMDDALDNLLAAAGLNSSIGFCQIKIKTAYWIEVQLNDTTSNYFPGMKTKGKLPVSQNPDDIISKLNEDSLNINYAAAYIKIIEEYWANSGFKLKEKQAVVATLYSTGLFKRDGTERKPNDDPKINWFGENFMEAIRIITKLI